MKFSEFPYKMTQTTVSYFKRIKKIFKILEFLDICDVIFRKLSIHRHMLGYTVETRICRFLKYAIFLPLFCKIIIVGREGGKNLTSIVFINDWVRNLEYINFGISI